MAVILLPSALVLSPAATVAVVAPLVIACHHFPVRSPANPPAHWEAINTTAIRDSSPTAQFENQEAIRRRALASHYSVIIFPEAAVGAWTEATELFWVDTISELRRQRKDVLIGAVLPKPGEHGYVNSVLILGNAEGRFDQRIPIPIGMWRPWAEDSFEMSMVGPASIEVQGRLAAILICYEQFLSWPWISALVAQPSVVLTLSDDSWTFSTSASLYRHAVGRSWAKLLALPLLDATKSRLPQPLNLKPL